MKTIPVKYIDTTKYIARINYDEDSDSPADWGNFTLVTFGRGDRITDTSMDEYLTENNKLKPALQTKLRAGTAFFVDIYEHGGTSYTLSGEGMNDRWDTSSKAGIIFLEKHLTDGESFESREDIARQVLVEYTDWANGEVYYVTIEEANGTFVDSCSGFIGLDSVTAYIKDQLPYSEPRDIEVTGESSEYITL